GFVERQGLLRQWFALRADQLASQGRLAQLTPREREVLAMLHEGSSTAVIAERLDISQTTVRSQIRAVLRKLGVRSQLAAVAALDASLSGSPLDP
ncbi:MAG: LuxR family transcriptional regulator, partial [Actinomycetales bacterium]